MFVLRRKNFAFYGKQKCFHECRRSCSLSLSLIERANAERKCFVKCGRCSQRDFSESQGKSFRSRSVVFSLYSLYLAIVCSLEAQHKKFIRRLYVVKACRACSWSECFRWASGKNQKQHKFLTAHKILKIYFRARVVGESFPLGFNEAFCIGALLEKLAEKNCLINVKKFFRCEHDSQREWKDSKVKTRVNRETKEKKLFQNGKVLCKKKIISLNK